MSLARSLLHNRAPAETRCICGSSALKSACRASRSSCAPAAQGGAHARRSGLFSNNSSQLSIEDGPYFSEDNAEACDFFPIEKAGSQAVGEKRPGCRHRSGGDGAGTGGPARRALIAAGGPAAHEAGMFGLYASIQDIQITGLTRSLPRPAAGWQEYGRARRWKDRAKGRRPERSPRDSGPRPGPAAARGRRNPWRDTAL